MTAHVSGVVCADPVIEHRAPAQGGARATRGATASIARAPPAPPWTASHARRSRFQLHSRPPRQRLPSSLVIEGVSASAAGCSSRFERRDTSDERSRLLRTNRNLTRVFQTPIWGPGNLRVQPPSTECGARRCSRANISQGVPVQEQRCRRRVHYVGAVSQPTPATQSVGVRSDHERDAMRGYLQNQRRGLEAVTVSHTTWSPRTS